MTSPGDRRRTIAPRRLRATAGFSIGNLAIKWKADNDSSHVTGPPSGSYLGKAACLVPRGAGAPPGGGDGGRRPGEASVSCSNSAWGAWGVEGAQGRRGARSLPGVLSPDTQAGARGGPSRPCTCWTGDKRRPCSGRPAPVPEHRSRQQVSRCLSHVFLTRRTGFGHPLCPRPGQGPGLHVSRLGLCRLGGQPGQPPAQPDPCGSPCRSLCLAAH